MKTSKAGRQFIQQWEKLFTKSYDDATERVVGPGDRVYGVLTIGYGHTSAAGPPEVSAGMEIGEDQADEILASDLRSVELDVNHLVTKNLTQPQFDALVSFHYNTGGLGRSSVLRDIEAGHFERVPADLAMWNKAGGKVLRGLVKRRHAEGVMFSQGIYNADH